MKKILYLFFCLLFFSCKKSEVLSMKDFHSDQTFDLSVLCDEPYDFLLILDEGNFLSQVDLQEYEFDYQAEKQWLGEKIFFILGKKIVKQINVDYYISEPKDSYGYVSFFYGSDPSDNVIFRDSKNSVFHKKRIQKLKNNSYCCYLE